MSARRRERPPQGRTNSARLSARDQQLDGKVPPKRLEPIDEFMPAKMSARPNTTVHANVSEEGGKDNSRTKTAPSPQISARKEREDLFKKEPRIDWTRPSKDLMQDTRRMRMLKPGEVMIGAEQFARPRRCIHAPLKSVFLDPEANTFPLSKTQSALKRKLKAVNIAHHSYDIDGDGVVDHEDMYKAKKLDVNGTGVLTAEEALLGKRMLSEDFFRNNKADLHLYTDEFLKNDEETNIKNLTCSHAFTETYNAIKLKKQSLMNYSSEKMFSCMAFPQPEVTKYNYYNDKFDATAWSDYGALPRKVNYNDHNDIRGSRERMSFLRKMQNRDYCSAKLESADSTKPKYSTKKIGLITNFSKYAN